MVREWLECRGAPRELLRKMGGGGRRADGVQEESQFGVASLGGVLLDPMGDSGEEVEGEIADERPGAIRGVPGEEAIFFAPEQKCWNVDGREAQATLPAHAAAPEKGSVPVDHCLKGSGLCGVSAGGFEEIARELGGCGGGAEHGLADCACAVAGEEALGEPRDLEGGGVPGAEHLPGSPEAAREADGMGNVDDDETIEGAELAGGEAPGDDCAPVVAEENDAGGAGGVDEAGDVGHEMFDGVVLQVAWTAGVAIAALVGRPDAEAHVGEGHHLLAPAEGDLREAMEAEGQGVSGTAGEDLEGEAVRLDEFGLQLTGVSLGHGWCVPGWTGRALACGTAHVSWMRA